METNIQAYARKYKFHHLTYLREIRFACQLRRTFADFSREFKEESAKARIPGLAIESLTYTCTDPQLVKNLNTDLEKTFSTFQSSLP